MNFTVQDLQNAVNDGIITQDQYIALLRYLSEQQLQSAQTAGLQGPEVIRASETDEFFHLNTLRKLTQKEYPLAVAPEEKNSRLLSRFGLTGVDLTYSIGGVLVIYSLFWFAIEANRHYHQIGLLLISIIYFVAFLFAGNILIRKKKLRLPGGLLLCAALLSFGMMVYSLQSVSGFPVESVPGGNFYFTGWINNGWLFIEVSALLLTLVLLHNYQIPFLTMGIAVVCTLLFMDASALLSINMVNLNDNWQTTWSLLGLFLIILAYLFDMRPGQDFAFWLYSYGLTALAFGIYPDIFGSSIGAYIGLCAALLATVISVYISRKTFLIFGLIGMYLFITYLTVKIFNDSLAAPLFFVVIGLTIIAVAVFYSRNKKIIQEKFLSFLPAALIRFIPPEHT